MFLKKKMCDAIAIRNAGENSLDCMNSEAEVEKRYNLRIYDLTHYLGSTFFLGQKTAPKKCRLRKANVKRRR